MAKRKKIEDRSDERLNSMIRSDGEGEDPAVKALITELPGASNMQAFDIALALQEIIRGQRSQGEDIAKLRAEMARMDKAAKAWEDDRQKFIDGVNTAADKLRLSEAEAEKLRAREGLKLQEYTQKAMAEERMTRQKFDDEIARGPKEVIVSPGQYKTIMQNGQQVAILAPDEIRIKHRIWILQPGVPTEVPVLVADRYRLLLKQRQETLERQQVLQGNNGSFLESGQVDARMKEIDNKYKTSTQRLST